MLQVGDLAAYAITAIVGAVALGVLVWFLRIQSAESVPMEGDTSVEG
jgi:hypothetical protein